MHHNEYTRSKAISEGLLRESGLRFLVVCPSDVLSAGIPDRIFARAILWFVPLLNRLACVPIDPLSRVDIVPVRFVVESLIALLRHPSRSYDTYHISAGDSWSMTCGEVASFLSQFYGRSPSLRLKRSSGWTKLDAERFVRTAQQRKVFSLLRYYLPFLNMNVVYANERLHRDLRNEMPNCPKLTEYLGDLLGMITYEEAIREAANP